MKRPRHAKTAVSQGAKREDENLPEEGPKEQASGDVPRALLPMILQRNFNALKAKFGVPPGTPNSTCCRHTDRLDGGDFETA